ncbi:MAG: thiamine phosphate synthase [Prevotellaceae bacterium]|nr:thiamine phosphate synthase [Prevotellaceae bacterium]
MLRTDLKLYLVTDRSFLHGRNLIDVVMQAVAGGVTMVQLREKDIDTRTFIELGFELKRNLQQVNIPLIINDRVDVAMAIDADGVHIGQSDMPYSLARRILGSNKIIGLSVENIDEVIKANSFDVDYIGISPVFTTYTKTDTAQPFGLSGLREAIRLSVHPTVAIGGINLQTKQDVLNCGTDGIAVVSAIMAAENPQKAAKDLQFGGLVV